jgi:hypothetical protein
VRTSGFKPDHASFEFFELAADNDFPDAFDRLGRIEG